MAELLTVEPGMTDKDYAKQVRSRLLAKLEEVCAVVNEEEHKSGLELNFQLGRAGVRMTPDGTIKSGLMQISAISVTRSF